MEEAGIGLVRFVLIGVGFQHWDVAAISITADHVAIRKNSIGKFLYGHLFDIECHL